ncbi:MAG TPA: hypothetical protein DCL00_00045, partial [Opitutae bacterium]|nr:hypothetical protein [Opitutae bacterium]
PVIEGTRGNGRLTFTRGGKPFPAPDLNASHFTVTNGQLVADSVYTDDNFTWYFAYELLEENRASSIIFHPYVFTDGYGQPNVSNYNKSKKLYRAITRSDDIEAWWSFNRDSLRSNQVQSDSADRTTGTIYDAWVTPRGRFGQGLAFDKTSNDGRMKIEPNGISLNEDGWTLSVWCKNVIPPKTNSYSTLFRGQDKQSSIDFDRYLVLRQQDQLIGWIDGDEEDPDSRFKSSNYTFQPYLQREWNHLVVLGEGARTKYFVNGVFAGQANVCDQSDLYYVGNSSGDELFAEFIDDLRIYGVPLSHAEVGAIYGGGFGDMFTSIQVDENSTLGQTPKVFDLYFGKDAASNAVDDLNDSWMVLSNGSINDVNRSEDNRSYRISITPDPNKTLHSLEIPDYPTNFESLSLWLDASDPQGGSFSFKSDNELTLWLDASDSSTITKRIGSDDIENWHNKINPAVVLKSINRSPPSFDETINGKTAVLIDEDNGNIERITAYLNGARWNPAGVNGQASGPLSDVFVMLVWRVDQNGRTMFPFNWGMGDHFPWDNGWLFWRYSGNNRTQVHLANNGETLLTALEYSVTQGTQKAYKNGTEIFSQAPRENRYIGGAFYFPGDSYWGSSYVPRFTLGEMLVMRGNLSEQERLIYEGYLSHKWGISDKLPNIHTYKSNGPLTFNGDAWDPGTSFAKLYWTDKSNLRNHASTNGNPSWNTNSQNSLPLMTYSGTDAQNHSFNMISDIRTVFWVISEDSSVSGSGLRYLLGDSTKQPDWHNNNDGKLWGNTWGNSNVYDGYTRVNGLEVDGKTTDKPTSLSVISLRTNGDVQGNNFSNDRNIGERTWKGNLGELLIFNEALDNSAIESIEGYLAHKWGLAGSLISGHPYETI